MAAAAAAAPGAASTSADGGSDVPMSEAVGDDAEGQHQQQQQGQGEQQEGRGEPGASGQGQPHSLLKAHAFFRALAAPPPPGREIPPATLAEAAEGEARKRGRLAAAEAARREERQRRREQQQAEAEAGASGSDAPAAADAAAALPAATAAPACGALVPPASFIAAVSRCTRIHAGQVGVYRMCVLNGAGQVTAERHRDGNGKEWSPGGAGLRVVELQDVGYRYASGLSAALDKRSAAQGYWCWEGVVAVARQDGLPQPTYPRRRHNEA